VADQHQGFAAYCEAIYELAEDDFDVIQARIADRLGVSRPAVSEMVRRMTAEGLVQMDGTIQLTDQGVALAEQIVRRHRLAERFLTDILELSWADAHRQANRWEHVIDDSVEAALDRILGRPTTCPHGNPIPGSNYTETAAVPLNGLGVGESFTVTRIPEELEFTPGVLDFLEENTVVPGRNGTLTAASPDGSVTVSIDERVVGLGTFASSRILVLPEPTPA
jgi:DtxR family transcriptional regulator, Mn-dependent transcriptional regulator